MDKQLFKRGFVNPSIFFMLWIKEWSKQPSPSCNLYLPNTMVEIIEEPWATNTICKYKLKYYEK